MKKWIKPVIIIFMGFLFARCSVLPEMYALGISVLSVTCLSKSFYYLFVGAVTGAIALGGGVFNIMLNTLPYALALPFFMLMKKRNIDSLYPKMLLAFLVFLLPALALELQFFSRVTLIFTGLFSVCLIPLVKRLYLSYLQLEARLSLEEADVLALCVIGGIMVASLPDLQLLGFRLPVWALLFTSSIAILAFGVRGSVWSTVAGIIFIIKGGDMISTLCLITGGVLGGLFSKKRGGILLGFVLGDILISLFMLNNFVITLGAVNLLAACLYTVFLKDSFIHRIKRLAGVQTGVNDLEMNYIEGLRDKQRSTLENAGRMYLELSKAFRSINRGEDFSKELVKETLKTCQECKKKEYCLKSRKSDTLIELKEASDEIIKNDYINAMPLTLTARCIQPINLVVSMQEAYKRLDRINEENPTSEGELALQLKSISDMLFSLADEISTLPQFDRETENAARDILKARIGGVKQVSCRKKGEGHMLSISLKENSKDIKVRVIKALEEGYLGKYQCLSGGSDPQGGFFGVFAPVPRFNIDVCALRENKKGQTVCGDSFTFLDTESKYIAAISDGAGSGMRAKNESESALDLLEAFSLADIPRNEVFKTMNRLLLLKGEREDYSTVDVTEFDLENGVMYWTKIGAVPGYILRQGKVERVEAGALPMGIVTRIDPVTTKKLVLDGDVIVLVSDGIYDGMVKGNEDGICDVLIKNQKESTENIAQNILSAAKNTSVDDDMTVMVLRVNAA